MVDLKEIIGHNMHSEAVFQRVFEFLIEHIAQKYYNRFKELAGNIDFVEAQTLRENVGETCQKLRDPACEPKVPYWVFQRGMRRT